MSRGDIRFGLTIGLFLLVAALLWFALKPPEPVVASADWVRNEEGGVIPGGPECVRARIEQLPEPLARQQAQRCIEAYEELRLKREDLVQQVRSTDAAVNSLRIAYSQSLMLLAGTIVGLLTLVAAFAAAWYAKRAARAAEDSLSHTKNLAKLQLRAHVDVDSPSLERIEDGGEGEAVAYRSKLNFKNFGVTAARNVSSRIELMFATNTPQHDTMTEPWEPVGTIAQGDHTVVRTSFSASKEQEARMDQGEFYLVGALTYEDVFEEKHERHFILRCTADRQWAWVRDETVEPSPA